MGRVLRAQGIPSCLAFTGMVTRGSLLVTGTVPMAKFILWAPGELPGLALPSIVGLALVGTPRVLETHACI